MNYERCNGFVYEIQENDSLYKLSRRFSIPLVELMRANPYADVYNLKIGDTVCIPNFPRPPVGKPPVKPIIPCNACTSWHEGTPPAVDSEKPVKQWSPDCMEGARPWDPENWGNEPEMNMSESSSKNCEMNSGSCQNNQKSSVTKYIVQENDTLGNILSDFNMDLDDFLNLNHLKQICLTPGSVILVKENK